jgi:hypothetical protein
MNGKTGQNITIKLDRETIRQAKIAAAKRGTSLSSLLAEQIRSLAANDDAYDTARLRAVTALARGFHMGGVRVSRDELHDR